MAMYHNQASSSHQRAAKRHGVSASSAWRHGWRNALNSISAARKRGISGGGSNGEISIAAAAWQWRHQQQHQLNGGNTQSSMTSVAQHQHNHGQHQNNQSA